MIEREAHWIRLTRSYEYERGYNMSKGGLGSPGWFMTDEIRENMRKGQLKRGKVSEETKQKMSNSHKKRHKDNPVSEETRKKLSEAKRGENHHYFGIASENHPNFGNKYSDESKKKISDSQKKRLANRKLLLEQLKQNVVELILTISS